MKPRFAFLSLVTILFLVVNLFSPVIARAEGEPPPEPGTSESPPEGGAIDSVPETPPEAPDMILVEDGGQAVLVVSEEAIPALLQSDPVWCPSTENPGLDLDPGTPGIQNNCTPNQASVTNLVNYLLDPDNNPATPTPYTDAGTIYFQNGAYAGPETQISFDSTLLADLTDLKLEGGWDLLTSTKVTDGFTTFGVPLGLDWEFALELQDLIISTLYDGYSLYIISEGSVTLDNVDVIDNDDGSGTYIDTCLMVDIDPDPDVVEWACTATGEVIISDSTFDDNGGDGLWVESGGAIELTNVSASDNGLYGAGLDNSFSGDGVSVSYSDFDGNDSVGLAIWTEGVISILSITADLNADGAILSGGGAISVSESDFIDNDYGGLWAYTSTGDITLYDLTASNNLLYGVLAGTEAGDIEVSGGLFLNNFTTDPELYGYGVGLEAGTLLGSVSLLDVVANGNDIGAMVGTADGDVLITGSDFSDNLKIGLEAGTMSGNVTLFDVFAGNTLPDGQEFGAYLVNLDGSITVTGGIFDDNLVKGLYIESTGGLTNPVILDGVEAVGNGSYGAYISYMAPCETTTGGVMVEASGGLYQTNGAYGIYALVGPEGDLLLDISNLPDFGSDETTWNGTPPGSLYNYLLNTDVIPCPPPCPPEEPKGEPKPFNIVEVPATGGLPVEQDCSIYSGTILILPAGDKIVLVCPASGTVDVKELVESELPGVLPGGPAFLSALEIILMDGDEPIPVITNGGYLTVAFQIPEGSSPADRFAILYWDPIALDGAGDWVELPAYRQVIPGISTIFPLHPDADPDDMMRILAGTHSEGGFIKADVNFPGVFVLIKR